MAASNPFRNLQEKQRMPEITKPLLQQLRVDMNDALKAVADKHGIAIRVGNCSFGEFDATYKLEISAAVGSDASPNDLMKAKAAKDWKRSLYLDGLKGDELGKVYKFAGKQFRVEGWLPRKQKAPVLATALDSGKLVCLPPDYILKGDLVAEKAAA